MGGIVTRFLAWIIRRMGIQTALALALLLATLGSVALDLARVVHGLDASLLLALAASGLVMGWLLAKSPLPGWLGGAYAFVLGTEALLLHLGRLGGPLLALLRSLVELAWQIARWPQAGLPDGSLLAPALAELETGARALLSHLWGWILAATGSQPSFDPIVTTLVWSIILWMAAVWAGWAVRRRDWVLAGIFPAGALLAFSLSYAWASPHVLVWLVGTTWLLQALVRHTARERHWQLTGTDFSLDIRLELGMAAIGVSLMLAAAAMLTPSVSVQQIEQFVRRLFVEEEGGGNPLADSLGLDADSRPATAFDRAQAAGLPRRHLLGSGPELSQQVVMMVYLEEQEYSSQARPGTAPRYYWRGFTYDHYTGQGWHTEVKQTVEYKAGELATFKAPSLASPFYRTVRQRIQAQALGGVLYVTGELLTADQDYSVAWRSPPETFADAFGAQIEAMTYRADSRLLRLSQAQLRSAGSDYPDWVRERYLALPDGVPERVLWLGHTLTEAESTPYDRARAIEGYLRRYPYTLDLPTPPPDRDVVDYFIFHLRRGYCDYYATAMVVLARAAGLPARLVVGYASGTYDRDKLRYVVTEADAHAWVEVYFPGYGWAEFEPTAGRPPIERPAETIPLDVPEPETKLEPAARGWAQALRFALVGLPAALLTLVVGGLAWWGVDEWRLRRLPPLAAVTALYQRLYRHGRRLAVPTRAGNTPHEFAAALARRMGELAQDKRRDDIPASAAQETRWLTDLYTRGLYSPHSLDAGERVQAIQVWRRLRRYLWLAWVWQKRN